MALAQTEWLLVGVAFFIAIWNTSVGPSAVTFAAMATLLPPPVVVPIHAVTSAAASVVRTLALREFVDWRFIAPFAVGGLAGFAVGIPFIDLATVSHAGLQTLLGAFILTATWVPFARLGPKKGFYATASGTITAFLTLFVGATTSLVAATIGQRHTDHRRVIGTAAGCMLYQHVAKIPIFGILGFLFGAYANLLVFFVVATTIGTWIGRRVLINAPQSIVKPIFKAVLTALALNLLWRGLST